MDQQVVLVVLTLEAEVVVQLGKHLLVEVVVLVL
jgi:hypothetical protein